VLDLGITFQPGEIRDVDGTVFADAAEVVAEEVGDHDQFGKFLGTGLEFVGKLGVAGWGRRRGAGCL